MAEEFLEEIYQIAKTASEIENVIEKYRKNVGTFGLMYDLNPIINSMMDFSKRLLINGDLRGKEIWESIQRIKSYGKIVQVLDEIEDNCLPIYKRYLENAPKIDVCDENLIFRSSKSGFLFLLNKNEEPLMSSINPMREARYIAKEIYSPEKQNIAFLGCGLGYVPYQLYLLYEGEIKIKLFLHDERSYYIAKNYGVIDWIPDNSIEVITSNQSDAFIKEVSEKSDDYYIYNPDINEYSVTEIEQLRLYSLSNEYNYAAKEISLFNFYRNTERVKSFITMLDKSAFKKKIAIVAGGPSVDENIEFMKNNRADISIISVGTVHKKLLNNGIIPDLTVVCDPYNMTGWQYSDISDASVPMILSITANWRVAKEYKGEKYLIAFGGVCEKIRQYCIDRGEQIFNSITNVSQMGFEVAVYLNAEEIYLIGMDFGYPEGNTHAKGTLFDNKSNVVDDMYEESVNGGKVLTTGSLRIFRQMMEEAINQVPEIKVINMSKSGAKIRGTDEYY